MGGSADRPRGGVLTSPPVTAMHVVAGSGGRGHAVARAVAAVEAAARQAGWSPGVVTLTELAAELAAGRVRRLVLCGGDGLVHRAVQLVAATIPGRGPVEVAVVPVGTGNDFARAFGISGEAAATLAATPPATRVRPVDLIRTTPHQPGGVPRFAVSVLTGGYSGRVNGTANGMRFPLGSAKYTVAALAEIGRLRPRPVRLELERADGTSETIEMPMTFFAIGNTAWFGGGMQICPGADPGDGLLDVVTVGSLRRLDFVRWLPKVFRGAHLDHPAVRTARVRAVTVVTGESLWADGEPVVPGGTVARVDVAPGALALVVPDRTDG